MNLDTDLMYDKRWRRKPKYGRVAVLLLLFAVALIVTGHNFSSKEQAKLKKSHGADVRSTRHAAMSAYFERKGSPDPQRMATAVLETTRPRLMASIAVRESGGDPKAVGDGGKSKGAFQVQKHWKPLLHEKRVSKDPVVQALDSERILDELLVANNGNMKKALSAYNGERTKKVYAGEIMREAKNIP